MIDEFEAVTITEQYLLDQIKQLKSELISKQKYILKLEKRIKSRQGLDDARDGIY